MLSAQLSLRKVSWKRRFEGSEKEGITLTVQSGAITSYGSRLQTRTTEAQTQKWKDEEHLGRLFLIYQIGVTAVTGIRLMKAKETPKILKVHWR